MITEIEAAECAGVYDAYFLEEIEEVGDLKGRKVRAEAPQHNILPLNPLPEKGNVRKYHHFQPMKGSGGVSASTETDTKTGEIKNEVQARVKVETDNGSTIKAEVSVSHDTGFRDNPSQDIKIGGKISYDFEF